MKSHAALGFLALLVPAAVPAQAIARFDVHTKLNVPRVSSAQVAEVYTPEYRTKILALPERDSEVWIFEAERLRSAMSRAIFVGTAGYSFNPARDIIVRRLQKLPGKPTPELARARLIVRYFGREPLSAGDAEWVVRLSDARPGDFPLKGTALAALMATQPPQFERAYARAQEIASSSNPETRTIGISMVSSVSNRWSIRVRTREAAQRALNDARAFMKILRPDDRFREEGKILIRLLEKDARTLP